LLKWAVANSLLEANPLAAAKSTRELSARETWLTEDDVDKLLAAADQVRDHRVCVRRTTEYRGKILRAFILCCVDSGLRKNEARVLRRDRIGPDGVVELLARQTKSRRRRIIALTPRTLAAISALPTEYRHTSKSARNWQVSWGHQPYIFINPERGDLLSDRTLWHWFRQAVEIAGLDARCAEGDVRLRVHDLRHSAASIADAKGAQATAIRDMLGHTNLGITERYLHRNRAKGAVELARLMGNPAKEGA
jgi:integrase